MYIYCVVCYHVIATPYLRSVFVTLDIVTILITIQNSQWTIHSTYSLKFVPYYVSRLGL